MRTFSAKSVCVIAVLAGAAAPAWAKVSVSAQQVDQQEELAAQAPTGVQSVAAFHPAPLVGPQPTVTRVDAATPVLDPEQEQANMGMMILVGLGMVGTLMAKARRP